MPDISMESFTLGTIICRFTVPQTVIDEINNDYDNAKDLSAHNKNLAGKIADEFKVTDILNDNTRSLFTTCFQTYLRTIQKPFWHVSLENAWINDMKANEYNPFQIALRDNCGYEPWWLSPPHHINYFNFEYYQKNIFANVV